MVNDYHESDGYLYDGTKKVFLDDLVKTVEGVFGLDNSEVTKIVDEFFIELEIKHRYDHDGYYRDISQQLTDELTQAINREILSTLMNLDINGTPEIDHITRIPGSDALSVSVKVNRSIEHINTELKLFKTNEKRDSGDG